MGRGNAAIRPCYLTAFFHSNSWQRRLMEQQPQSAVPLFLVFRWLRSGCRRCGARTATVGSSATGVTPHAARGKVASGVADDTARWLSARPVGCARGSTRPTAGSRRSAEWRKTSPLGSAGRVDVCVQGGRHAHGQSEGCLTPLGTVRHGILLPDTVLASGLRSGPWVHAVKLCKYRVCNDTLPSIIRTTITWPAIPYPRP
jgi:hypothetical protein